MKSMKLQITTAKHADHLGNVVPDREEQAILHSKLKKKLHKCLARKAIYVISVSEDFGEKMYVS